MLGGLKKYRYHLMLFFISSLITFLAIFAADFNLDSFIIVDEQKLVDGLRQEHKFDDFNNDGIPEIYAVANQPNQDMRSILFVAWDNTALAQLNFPTSVLDINSIYLKDYNEDGSKEAFIIYIKTDSVFLKITSSHNWENVLENDLLLYVKPDIIFADNWDATSSIFHILETETDIFIYFFINTGFAQKPRGLYKYSLNKYAIVHKIEFGANPQNVIPHDFNRDGKIEFIVNTSANGNNHRLPEMPYINDMKSWFIFLDENLDTLYTISYQKGFGASISKIYQTSKATRVLTSFNSTDSLSKPEIILHDFEGNIVSQFHYSREKLEIHYGDHIYETDEFFAVDGKLFHIMNDNLEIIKKIKCPFVVTDYKLYDLDDDGIHEILLLGKGIVILNEDYEIAAYREFQNKHLNVAIASYDNSTRVFFDSYEESIEFYIEENFLGKNKTILFAASNIAVYLFLLALQLVLVRIYLIFNALKLSTIQSVNGLMLLDRNRKLVYSNHIIKEIFGIGESKEALQLNNNWQLLLTVVSQLRNRSSVDMMEKDFVLNQNQVQMLITITTLNLFKRVTLGYFIQMENLTEALKTERSKVLSHSLQKVAHEIKTPLSSVLLSLDSIEENLSSANKNIQVDSDIEIARNEVGRVKLFINNFLKYADMNKINTGNVSLLPIIQQAVSKFDNYIKKGIQLNVDVDSAIEVTADQYQLVEVLQVLIENAIDAVKGNGEIEITAAEVAEDKVLIKIGDNGEGIKEKDLLNIFKPYVTTRKDGTGMGLAIAEKIVNDHGSKITVDSKPGKGSRFSFYLKRANSL